MNARDLSADEKAEVARFGIHDEEPRWKVACINWSYSDAPHALVYLLIDGSAYLERFFATWDAAIAWLHVNRHDLGLWAAQALFNVRMREATNGESDA